MARVQSITVSNLKAISSLTAHFNGCTAIVTGGNNKGKTSFLRSLFDRVRGTKPDKVLKEGETEGFAEVELTSKEKLRWEFNDKGKGFKEKLTYITDKDIKTSLTVELRNKLLPPSFDVDRFLQDQPAKQRKTLQQLVGLDFTDIDARHKIAYDDREAKNRRANEEKIVLENWIVPEKVEAVNMDELLVKKETVGQKLNTLYLENKAANDKSRKSWQEECETKRDEHEKACKLEHTRIVSHNNDVSNRTIVYNEVYAAIKVLVAHGYKGDAEQYHQKLYREIGDKLEYKEPFTLALPSEPTYIDELPDKKELDDIDQQIVDATETNRKAQLCKDYESQKNKATTAKGAAALAQDALNIIEKERMDMIRSAKMPEGFGFSEDGITYNNLPFTREQLSSSGIYIAALKLAAMTLGEVRTLHFDASFLDRLSLEDIEKWAVSEDLQLLIERPDWEGGEIEYQLIQLS